MTDFGIQRIQSKVMAWPGLLRAHVIHGQNDQWNKIGYSVERFGQLIYQYIHLHLQNSEYEREKKTNHFFPANW